MRLDHLLSKENSVNEELAVNSYGQHGKRQRFSLFNFEGILILQTIRQAMRQGAGYTLLRKAD